MNGVMPIDETRIRGFWVTADRIRVRIRVAVFQVMNLFLLRATLLGLSYLLYYM